jgi:hypothetical protein
VTIGDVKLSVLVCVPIMIAGLAAATTARRASFPERDTEHVWLAGTRATARPSSLMLPTRAEPALASTQTLSVAHSFQGLISADTPGDPPDPVIGAGAGFVVQIVNSAVRVWTNDGVARADYPLPSFAEASSADVSDPRIVFDPDSGRWFASVVDVARATVQLAVSLTSDPTGAWAVYSHATGSCPDQPSLGVGRDLVVVGYTAYSLPCRSEAPPSYLGGALFAYDKQQLLDGLAPPAADWGPRLDFSPVTAVSSGRTAIAVAVVTPMPTGGPTYLELLGGRPPGLTITRLPIDPLTPPPGGAQPGTTREVETNDDRILSAVVDGGTLWLAGNDGCVPPRDAHLRSCLRIIAVAGGRITLDTDLGAKGQDFFYPALAAGGNGDLVVVHGTSSGTTYPGLAALAITSAHRQTRAVAIARGALSVLSDRFGDYFGAAADADGRVWVTGETAAPSGWATTVASVAQAHRASTPVESGS